MPGSPLTGRPLINVGIVEAGDYFNRLPVHLSVTGTYRWTPGTTVQDVRTELTAIANRMSEVSGLRCTVNLAGVREPFETSTDHPLVQALRSAGERVDGHVPDAIGMGLVGDANLYVNEGGVPTVYFGPAHETAHSDEERIDIRSLTHIARVYALTAISLCGLVGPEQ